MAIPITRKEYENKFGVKPVIPEDTFDTTPAPIRITRAEYDELFRPKEQTRLQKAGSQIKESFEAGFEKSTKGFESISKDSTPAENRRGALKFLAGGIEAAFAPLAPVFAPIGKGIGTVADKISENEKLQKFAVSESGRKAIQTTEDIVDLTTVADAFLGAKVSSNVASKVRTAVPKTVESIQQARKASAVSKIEREILNIENSYNKLATKNAMASDAGNASRRRIAETDVLVHLVDEDGKITIDSANTAAKEYRRQTIEGAEGVVRDILTKEGKTVNLEQVRKALLEEIATSRLEGGDLLTAMNGLKKELKGLQMRADEFGNIVLDKIHDAKISTTKHIDYDKPAQITYRNALASGYKKMVEQFSEATVKVQGKKYTIKEINEKLGIYLDDIKRIQQLGGKRVKGGRLGKYSAQVAGNLAGAAAGGLIGGPAGMVIGTVVGGEVASKIRGKQMASTFGKAKGKIAPKDALLEASKLKAKNMTKDLTIPDKKVGAIRGTPKTKEVAQLEAKISKNVEAQKKAIQAGDFTLVAALKEAYKVLVEKLKKIIKEFKELPKNGGFIKNPFFNDSSKAGMQPKKGKLKSTSSKPGTSSEKVQIPADIRAQMKVFVDYANDPKKVKDLEIEADAARIAEDFNIVDTANKKSIKSLANTFADTLYEYDASRPIKASGKPTPIRGEGGKFNGSKSTKGPTPYKGEKDLTTKILKDLEGKTTVSKQYILDATNRGELKQVERDLIRDILEREKPSVQHEQFIAEKLGGKVKDYDTVFATMKGTEYPKSFQTAVGRGAEIILPDNRIALRSVEDATSIKLPGIAVEKTGTGTGTKAMDALREYADKTGKEISIYKVTNPKYFDKLSWLKKQQDGSYLYKPSDTINVSDFAKKVKAELLPLKVKNPARSHNFQTGRDNPMYENIALPDELRGKVANYKENIYESPVKTSAGANHFGNQSDSYFGHTRIEDMADNKTRRVIEVQSDLYQKGNLEKEFQPNVLDPRKKYTAEEKALFEEYNVKPVIEAKKKLAQYNDPTAHFRMVREEIKKAAQDGKTKLQFPTGETAMKIEGLGENTSWTRASTYARNNRIRLDNSDMKVGLEINDGNSDWIITDVLGDGKFVAVTKREADMFTQDTGMTIKQGVKNGEINDYPFNPETFDISGKVDTNNPIYKFYEKDMQKYLDKFGGKRITDDNGVEWIEVPIKKEWAKIPVEAFALIPMMTMSNE